MAQRLELDPPRLAGDAVMVAEGVLRSPNNGYPEFSLSRQGTLVFGQGSAVLDRARFAWVDRSGKLLSTIGEPAQVRPPASLSPDGARVAYFAGPSFPQADVWVMDLTHGLSTRITFNRARWPQWSPDGKFVFYNNETGIYRKPADGSGDELKVADLGMQDYVNAVSPDGKALLIGRQDIMKLSLTAGTGGEGPKPEPYVQTSNQEWQAAFSPDGRWVAYRSNESGQSEIYVQGYPEKRGKWLVSTAGGSYPVWRADGKELFWVGTDWTAMAADIELNGDSVRPGRAQRLFHIPVHDVYPVFQPNRDGQRFLVLQPATPTSNRPLVMIQNWAAALP